MMWSRTTTDADIGHGSYKQKMMSKRPETAVPKHSPTSPSSTVSRQDMSESSHSGYSRRGSESTQQHARQLFRRPSEPCWTLTPGNSTVPSSSSSIAPSVPQPDEIGSLHFSVSSFGDWLNESAGTSPMTTPEDITFGGLYLAASNMFEQNFQNSVHNGMAYEHDCRSNVPKRENSLDRMRDYRMNNYSGLPAHAPYSINRNDTASPTSPGSAIEHIGIDTDHGHLAQAHAYDDYCHPVAIGGVNGEQRADAPYSPRKPHSHHRKPSWLLNGGSTSRPTTSPKTSSKTSQNSGYVTASETPEAAARSSYVSSGTPPSMSREMSHSSISSTSVSEWGSSYYNIGAVAKTRPSPMTSVTSTRSMGPELDHGHLPELLDAKLMTSVPQLADAHGFSAARSSNQSVTQTSSPTSATESTSTASVRDDSARRARIIMEIISTEETYAKCLEELVDIYVNPAASTDSSGQPMIPAAERRQVFTNVEGILEFHRSALLPALKTAASPLLAPQSSSGDHDSDEAMRALTASVSEDVASTFERHAAFFRMYTSYVNCVDSAQRRVQAWQTDASPSTIRARFGTGRLSASASMLALDIRNSLQNGLNGGSGSTDAQSIASSSHASSGNKNGSSIDMPLNTKDRKRIKGFLLKARVHPRHTQISLEAYLLLPVQRIPRYRLLLEELVRFCPPERLREPDAIANALDSISGIATSMNESKRQSEMDRRLLQWQERIRGQFPSPLVQPHRKLVKDGTLTLKRIEPRLTATARTSSLGSRSESGRRNSTTGRLSQTSGGAPGACSNLAPSAAAMYVDKGMDFFDVSCPLDEQGDKTIDVEDDFVSRSVEVLLCNDIIVIVEEAQGTEAPVVTGSTRSERAGSISHHLARTMSSNGTPSVKRMDLVAVMRMCSEIKLVEQTVLRLVDPVHIIYLEAPSADEAHAWLSAMECVHQRTPYVAAVATSPSIQSHVSPSTFPMPTAKKSTPRTLRQVKSHQILSKARGAMF